MAVLAVSGYPASGKSTVVGLLKAKGAVVFDADRCVHRYYKDRKGEIYKRVAKIFNSALNPKGAVCRRRLGKIVFQDSRKLRFLEKIVYPRLRKDLKSWVEKNKTKKGCYVAEVPLLFEKKMDHLFETIVLVTAPRKALIERMAIYRRLSLSQARRRLGFYLPIQKKIRKADVIIRNDADMRKLRKEVNFLWKNLNKR